MSTGFKVAQIGGYSADLDEILVRREFFSEGTLYTWGAQGSPTAEGLLGDNSSVGKSSPITTSGSGVNWKKVSLSLLNTFGIKTDGTLWGWGRNASYQLADGTNTNRSSPVQIAGTDWIDVGVGNGHWVGLKNDGSVWTCGYNNSGQLGDNTAVTKSSPVTIIGGSSGWKMVSAGALHCAAIRSDGSLWTWGANYEDNIGPINPAGQLGDNSSTTRSSPVPVSGGGVWKYVAAGSYSTFGIKTDGSLWVWGANSLNGISTTLGILGDGTTTNKSSPVSIAGGGTNWKQANPGLWSSGGVKTDGTLWTWGRNANGELGDGTTVGKSSPVQVPGTTWKQVSSGGGKTMAVKTDGTLWGWGYNGDGRAALGNTITNVSSPNQVSGGGTNWKQVSCAYVHGGAVRDLSF